MLNEEILTINKEFCYIKPKEFNILKNLGISNFKLQGRDFKLNKMKTMLRYIIASEEDNFEILLNSFGSIDLKRE